MASERKKFTDDCVQAMNTYRRLHQASPLQHNCDLSSMAQRWADQLASQNMLSHSRATFRGQPLGENCFMMSSSAGRPVSGGEVVDSWYSEIKNYNFRTHSGSDTGHFTQVVWKGSQEVGVGKAVSRDGRTCIVVANYYPAGNFRDRHAENVFPASGGRLTVPAQSTPSNGKVTDTQTTSSKPGFFASMFGRKTPEPSASPVRHDITVARSHSPVTVYVSPNSGSGSQRVVQTEWTQQPGSGSSSYTQTVHATTTAVRREIRQETSGSNTFVKTYTSETVVQPDGSRKTVTTENMTRGSTPVSARTIGYQQQSIVQRW